MNMDKIAMYLDILDDHPLWAKEAEMDPTHRNLLAGGAAALAGGYAVHRARAPGMRRALNEVVSSATRKGQLEQKLLAKYRSMGLSAQEARRRVAEVAAG
jgi:hypothetical protein